MPLLQGHSTDGLAGHVQSLKPTQQDSRGTICHCPKPFCSERRRNSKIRGGNCFSYSSKLHPALTAEHSACCLCMGPGFPQLQGVSPCISASPSVFLGSSVSHHTLADLPLTPPAQAHGHAFVSVASAVLWSLAPVSFLFIPKEGQHLSLLVSALTVSGPPACPTAGAGRCGAGQGTLPCIKWWRWKEMPGRASFSISLHNLID